MKIFIIIVYIATLVSAFTNGTLLPNYLCGENDGSPKSLGLAVTDSGFGLHNTTFNTFLT